MRGKSARSARAGIFRVLGVSLLAWTSVLAVQALSSGCSSRSGPTTDADSTRVYRAKDPGGLEARIVLCSKSPSRKTGKRRGVSDVFTAAEGAKIYAFVDLENQFALGRRPLEFHLAWIDPEDDDIFTKRIEYMPTDSTSTLRSRITIPPTRRPPGRYALRVYFFRELIAERSFEIRHQEIDSPPSS